MTRASFAPLLAALVASCASAPVPAPAAAIADGATVDLVVATTTDVHGRVRGWEYYADAPDPGRGLSRVVTVVDSLRSAYPGRVVLVDAGDLLQGNPLAYVAARVSKDTVSPVVAAMNVAGYDALAVGNHEFNYGVDHLLRAARQASFPFLAANVTTAAGARGPFPASRMIERAGVRIAIVGATTPGSMVWDRDNLRGRLRVNDIVPAVRDAVADVRRRGADVVVVVIHSGLTGASSYDTVATGLPSENVAARVAREVSGIDVLTYGHSHLQLADTTIGGALLMQAKNYAASVAVAHLAVRREGGRFRVGAKRGVLVPVAGRAEDPRVLAATDRAHRETVAYVTTPIGRTPVAWRADSSRAYDSPIVDFMLETMRRAGQADLASTASFSTAATLDSGAITIAQLARLYPYDNTLRVVRVTGRQLRDYLEYSARYYRGADSTPMVDPRIPGFNFDIVAGADYTLDLTQPIGSRVTRLAVNGRPVRDEDTFTLALNNYRQTGGGGYSMLRDAPLVADSGVEIRQLLIDEVRRAGTLRPGDYHRINWRLEPTIAAARAVAASQETRPGETPARPPARADVTLRLMSTNDFHGSFEPRPDSRGIVRGGAASLATLIDRQRAGCAAPACETLLLDAGDMFQGTPVSNLSFGRPVVALYAMLGYAAAALGNHEFDWTVDTLRARMREAPHAILGANVRYTDGRDVEWIRNDTLVRRGPVTVGVIGLSTQSTPTTTRASNVAGLRFDPPAPIVDSIARALRARGADAIVVVAHAGAQCQADGATDCGGEIVDLARRVTERLDAIVSGHTHSLVDVTVNGIPIVQARSNGRALAVLDLPFVRGADGRLAVVKQGDAPGRVYDVITDSLPPAARIDSFVKREVARVAPRVSRRIAVIAEAMPRQGVQHALGNLVADAQRSAGRGDIAVMNNGGIRADLRAGDATYGSLFEIQPFGNVLYAVTVKGDRLRRYLERLVGRRLNAHISGAVVTYDTTRTAGSRIVSVRFTDGRALRDDATYRVVLNDFMVTGGDGLGLAGEAISTRPLNIVDLDALISYLRSRPAPVRAPAGARFLIVRPPR